MRSRKSPGVRNHDPVTSTPTAAMEDSRIQPWNEPSRNQEYQLSAELHNQNQKVLFSEDRTRNYYWNGSARRGSALTPEPETSTVLQKRSGSRTVLA